MSRFLKIINQVKSYSKNCFPFNWTEYLYQEESDFAQGYDTILQVGSKISLFMIIMMETGHTHRLFSRISTQPLWKLQMTTVKPLLMHG